MEKITRQIHTLQTGPRDTCGASTRVAPRVSVKSPFRRQGKMKETSSATSSSSLRMSLDEGESACVLASYESEDEAAESDDDTTKMNDMEEDVGPGVTKVINTPE